MNCDTVRVLLQIYGPLGAPEVAEAHLIEEHLAECPDCRRRAQEDDCLAQAMRDVQVPRDAQARVLSMVRSGSRTQARRARAAMAAVIALLALAAWIGVRGGAPAPVDLQAIWFAANEQ